MAWLGLQNTTKVGYAEIWLLLHDWLHEKFEMHQTSFVLCFLAPWNCRWYVTPICQCCPELCPKMAVAFMDTYQIIHLKLETVINILKKRTGEVDFCIWLTMHRYSSCKVGALKVWRQFSISLLCKHGVKGKNSTIFPIK